MRQRFPLQLIRSYAARALADVKAKFDLLLAQSSVNSRAEFQKALTAHIEKNRTFLKTEKLKFD
jgi:hypothetical protein